MRCIAYAREEEGVVRTGVRKGSGRRVVDGQLLVERCALDSLELAVFGLGSDGVVTYANLLGRRVLARGEPVRLVDGCLEGSLRPAARLAEVVLTVCRSGHARSVRLGDAACATIVSMAGVGVGSELGQAGAIAIVTLFRRRVASARQLMQLFGLTAAEAQLARALAHGRTAEGYARAQGVAVSTVRSHLRAALVKTGTRRQLELVSLIMGIAPIREAVGEGKEDGALAPVIVRGSTV